MKFLRKLIASQQGVSAVEFALILPLLLFILFGIIEFGVVLFDKAVVTNASREGARAGIVHVHQSQVSDEEIDTVVMAYAQNYLISLGSPLNEVTMDPPDRSEGNLTVTVRYIYDFLVLPDIAALIPGAGFDGTIELVGRTIMRMEDGGGSP
ncbi:MAG: pilus assembly protein [Desulfobulbaceae bacterium]|nr:pilus assembly protein [Desulfobulbaceae bacterium]